MKHTSVWGKILLLVMSVVLALSCLVACNDEEIGALEDSTAAIEADLTELKALVSQIKTTADAAATAAKLTEVATKLDAVSAKADAAATATALAEAKDALNALIQANKDGLASANTAIAAAEAAIEAVEAKFDGKVADFTKEIAAIKAAATTLETSLKAEIATLKTDYATLKASVDAKASASDVEKIASDVAALQAALELANEQIKALNDAPNFAENYQFATAVLYGDELVEGVEYSLEAFDKLVATVKASDYAKADYDAFAATVARLEFFLGRAISVDAIIDCFDKLEAAIDGMPTLLESLQAKVDAITVVTTKANCLDDVKGVYDKIAELNADGDAENDINIGAELQAKYDLIVAAHDNLVAAAGATGDAVAAIEAIGYVVYIDSADEIAAAKTAIDAYSAAYFANADYNEYYEVKATDLISNYDVYVAADARYKQLTDANTGKVVVDASALDYDNNRPLWSKKADLDEDKAEYTAWLTTYEIDETKDATTIANIYGTEIEYLNKASAYADAMALVYSNTEFAEEIVGVEALNAAIDALLEKNAALVLWTEKANAEDLIALMEALEAAIAGVADYDVAKDANYAEMITAARKSAFDAMYATMEQYELANTMLDGLYDANVGKLGNVSFNDFNDIEALRGAVAQVYTDYLVSAGDANYVAFAAEKDVNTLVLNLETEYNGITAKVREIYDNVNKYLDPDADMPLAFGNQLDGFMAEVVKIMGMGVTNVNLPLLGEGDAEDVNLSTLFDNLELVIDKYVAKAEAAQTAAGLITDKIAGMPTADTLNNYDAILGVYDELVEWIETYLAADVLLADGDIAAALAAVVDVKVFGVDDKYVFVSEDSYNACVEKYDAIVALYDEAEAAWNESLEARVDKYVTEAWDIHTEAEFDEILAAWNAYVAKYYGTSIADGVGEFDEISNYELFYAEYEECKDLVGEADGKKATIENAIGALENITATNYEVQLGFIAAINDLINEYVATYCSNAVNEDDWCELCLDRDLIIALRVKEATAKLYEYAEATKALTDDAKDAEIDRTLTMWLVVIADGKNTTTLESSLATAKSAIAKKAPCCVPDAAPDAHLDENDDCKCDLCGNTVAHVDEDPKDCVCDKCATPLGHVDEDPKDCVCDNCETNFGHSDDNDDCVCDACSTALDHNDGDFDCVCDKCGDPCHDDKYLNIGEGGIFGGASLDESAVNPDGKCDLCGAAVA